MILYMLRKVQFRLSNSQIVTFFQEKNYTDYFSLQEVLSELIDTELIIIYKTKTKSMYSISPSGIDCIKYFEKDINKEITLDINNYLNENRIKLKEESNCIADFKESENYSYTAHCEIIEGKESLISIDINMPDAESARLICENWKDNSQDIYNYLIKKLLE
ncbi:MAG: DUF4364 family protein [Eubacteriales bacterium]|nr:DUF4364 family protein [Eubacteriales bacterium]